ncbi:hypothetical protein HMI56_006685 [Coelomomyces lativittatus]|nr:hypothetical protein HMI56_006685 [Coelomomyces lativittatus]
MVQTINPVDPPVRKSQSSSSLQILSSPTLLSKSVLVSSTDSLPIPPSPNPKHRPPPLVLISSSPSHSAGLPSSSSLPALTPRLLSIPLPSLSSSSKSSPPFHQIPYCRDPVVQAALRCQCHWVHRPYSFNDDAGFNCEVLLSNGSPCLVLLPIAHKSHGRLCDHLSQAHGLYDTVFSAFGASYQAAQSTSSPLPTVSALPPQTPASIQPPIQEPVSAPPPPSTSTGIPLLPDSAILPPPLPSDPTPPAATNTFCNLTIPSPPTICPSAIPSPLTICHSPVPTPPLVSNLPPPVSSSPTLPPLSTTSVAPVPISSSSSLVVLNTAPVPPPLPLSQSLPPSSSSSSVPSHTTLSPLQSILIGINLHLWFPLYLL